MTVFFTSRLHNSMGRAYASARICALTKPAWFALLRALCAVAEGAVVLAPHPLVSTDAAAASAAASAAAAAACVAAVLGDTLQRLSTMGGREGMPRSVGSLWGSFVVRFAGGFRGVQRRVIKTASVKSLLPSAAVTRDGSKLLVTAGYHTTGIRVYCVTTGAYLGSVGCRGDKPLQFEMPTQLWVASDDFVFVADCGNHRIQILTPQLVFERFIGVGRLSEPSGVCADDDSVFVAEHCLHRVSVFARRDDTILRRFGSRGYRQLLNLRNKPAPEWARVGQPHAGNRGFR